METIAEKNIINEVVVNVIDRKLLETEEFEARDRQYYSKDEMDKFFTKYKNAMMDSQNILEMSY